jgi:hypothetical protein
MEQAYNMLDMKVLGDAAHRTVSTQNTKTLGKLEAKLSEKMAPDADQVSKRFNLTRSIDDDIIE